jgi:hypothetical protein
MRVLEVFHLFVISFSPTFRIEQVIPPEEIGTQFSSVCFEKVVSVLAFLTYSGFKNIVVVFSKLHRFYELTQRYPMHWISFHVWFKMAHSGRRHHRVGWWPFTIQSLLYDVISMNATVSPGQDMDAPDV